MLQLGMVKLAKWGTSTCTQITWVPFFAILVPSAGNTISPASKTTVARQLGDNTGVYTQDHIRKNSFLQKTVTYGHTENNSFLHTITGDCHITFHLNVNSTCVLCTCTNGVQSQQVCALNTGCLVTHAGLLSTVSQLSSNESITQLGEGRKELFKDHVFHLKVK